MLLLEAAKRHQPSRRPARSGFKGLRPLFHFASIRIMGVARLDGVHDLLTVDGVGAVGMQASVRRLG